MKTKTVFIDIDGTLRNSKRKLTKRTIDVLKKVKAKGINCYLTTGRPRWKTKAVCLEADMGEFIISTTGSDIYNLKTDEVVFQQQMDKNALKKIYEIAMKHSAFIKFQAGFDIITNKRRTPNHPYRKLLPENIDQFLNNNVITQVLVEDFDIEKVKVLYKEILKIKEVKITNHTKVLFDKNPNWTGKETAYIDINSPNVSKGEAVKILCDKLNLDLKDVICIGDSQNDISMLEIAGKSVVMGNAKNEIKKYADFIALSNDEDGVARFLEQEFLS